MTKASVGRQKLVLGDKSKCCATKASVARQKLVLRATKASVGKQKLVSHNKSKFCLTKAYFYLGFGDKSILFSKKYERKGRGPHNPKFLVPDLNSSPSLLFSARILPNITAVSARNERERKHSLSATAISVASHQLSILASSDQYPPGY